MRPSTSCLFHSTSVWRLLPGLLLLSACGPSETLQQTDAGHEERTSMTKMESDRLEALFWERQQASRDRFTSADEQFMVGMIAHHSQALIMTELARANGAGDGVLQMSNRIENTQHDEIATMQQWLRDRGLPVPLVTIDGIEMAIEMEMPERAHHESEPSHRETSEEESTNTPMHHAPADGMAHHHNMPGMLTRQQLDRMARATNNAFDELFLRYMIEHHEGAIYMVQELLASEGAAQHPETFRLASDIHADQQMEIDRMEQMLQSMGSPRLESSEHEASPSTHHEH